MPEEKERRTLQEMIQEAAESRAKRKGIRCPKCGCPDLRVKVTWKGEGKVKRRRVCANCGTVVPTYEAGL